MLVAKRMGPVAVVGPPHFLVELVSRTKRNRTPYLYPDVIGDKYRISSFPAGISGTTASEVAGNPHMVLAAHNSVIFNRETTSPP